MSITAAPRGPAAQAVALEPHAFAPGELATVARGHEAVLAMLRRAVAERSGADNAQLLHDHAAEAFRRLLAGAGAYSTATEVRGG